MYKIALLLAFLSTTAIASPDSDLNAAYQQLLKTAPENSTERKAIKAAQFAWLKFRDLDCTAQIPNFGTQPYFDVNYQNCIDSHAQTRTKQLIQQMQP